MLKTINLPYQSTYILQCTGDLDCRGEVFRVEILCETPLAVTGCRRWCFHQQLKFDQTVLNIVGDNTNDGSETPLAVTKQMHYQLLPAFLKMGWIESIALRNDFYPDCSNCLLNTSLIPILFVLAARGQGAAELGLKRPGNRYFKF